MELILDRRIPFHVLCCDVKVLRPAKCEAILNKQVIDLLERFATGLCSSAKYNQYLSQNAVLLVIMSQRWVIR